MAPLRAVDGIGGSFHPTEGVARLREVFGQGVAGTPPLAALVARFAQAQLAADAGRGIDDLQTFIRMVGVAEYALAAAVGRDVPGIVFHDGTDLARGPIHAAQGAR